jgi:hypothetical protein
VNKFSFPDLAKLQMVAGGQWPMMHSADIGQAKYHIARCAPGSDQAVALMALVAISMP